MQLRAFIALFCFLVCPAVTQAQAPSVFSMPKCTPLPVPLQMHGSVVARNRVYVMGGDSSSGWMNNVYSADILPSGLLGSWREERPMPEIRCYLSNNVVFEGNCIYVVGGTTGASADTKESSMTRANDVLICEVMQDGTLSEWKKSSPFSSKGLSNSAVCSSRNWLYVVGGKVGSSDVIDSVNGAEFQSDGSLGNWRSFGKIPSPLWFHGAASVGGRLYVWGGCTGPKLSTTNPSVYSAGQSSDGSLTGWITEIERMPNPPAGAPCRGSFDMLVTVGGRYADVPSRDIWLSKIVNGSIQQWKKVRTDIHGNVFHALAVDSDLGRVYISGGQSKNENKASTNPAILSTVQALQIEAPRK
jgi:hypothetical protein